MVREKKYQEIHQQLNLQNCIKALLIGADSRRLTKMFLDGKRKRRDRYLFQIEYEQLDNK